MIELDMPMRENASLRAQLEHVRASGGNVPELEQAEGGDTEGYIPEEGGDLIWSIFSQLCAARQSNGFGPMRISYGEIDAYQRCMHRILEPWQIEVLLLMDRAFVDKTNEVLDKRSKEDR